MRKVFEHQHDDLPVGQRQALDRGPQPRPMVGVQRLFFRVRPGVNRFERVRKLIEHLMRGPPPAGMSETAVVSDAVDKSALGALSPKMRQRLPDGQRDLLGKVLADARQPLVAKGETRQGRPILAHDARETFVFAIPNAFAHQTAPLIPRGPF